MGLIISPWEELTLGVEWEPRLVLPNYPKGLVLVQHMPEGEEILEKYPQLKEQAVAVIPVYEPLETGFNFCINRVVLKEKFDGRISVDHGVLNLEIHSPLTNFKELPEAFRETTDLLGQCIQWFSRELKTPVGALLPTEQAGTSKHVNISGTPTWLEDRYNAGYCGVEWHDILKNARLHCQFPYAMPITIEWLQNIRDEWKDFITKDPYLVCTSQSGRRYTILNNLF